MHEAPNDPYAAHGNRVVPCLPIVDYNASGLNELSTGSRSGSQGIPRGGAGAVGTAGVGAVGVGTSGISGDSGVVVHVSILAEAYYQQDGSEPREQWGLQAIPLEGKICVESVRMQ
jgi:hypothetical protein